MPIIKSEIVDNSLQAHGMRDITELHTDHTGKKHRFLYSVSGGINLTKRLNGRVAGIEKTIKQREILLAVEAVLNGQEIKLEWCTWSEVKALLQERETEKQEELIQVTDEKENLSAKIKEIGV